MGIRALSPQQLHDLHADGYVIIRNLVNRTCVDTFKTEVERIIRGGPEIHPELFDLEKKARNGKENAIPIGERYRKLKQLGTYNETLWDNGFAHPDIVKVARDLLGESILLKFSSVFLKPARSGGATPWHQDIGLWRDDNHEALNLWMAIDAATRDNGCLQFVPGSHKGPVIPHIQYEDGVHPELPREACRDLKVVHVELQPGDVVFWHSNMWHYSPPNYSDKRRIGIGAVMINPQQIPQMNTEHNKALPWVMLRGQRCEFPSRQLGFVDPQPIAVSA